MFEFVPGATSKSVHFKLRDTTTGLGKTGLAFNSTGVAAGYTRMGGTPTAITPVTLASPTASWTSAGFVEVDATNQPGVYRFDVPDAVLASGVDYATITIGFDDTFDETLLIRLRASTSLAGDGATVFTVTAQDELAAPLPGAAVWFTSDALGATVVAGVLYTNSSGQAVFRLDPGTYYLWVSHPGYSGTNPTSVTVT